MPATSMEAANIKAVEICKDFDDAPIALDRELDGDALVRHEQVVHFAEIRPFTRRGLHRLCVATAQMRCRGESHAAAPLSAALATFADRLCRSFRAGPLGEAPFSQLETVL